MSTPTHLDLATIIWFDDDDNEEPPPQLTPEEQSFWMVFAHIVDEWLDGPAINHLANALHLDSFRLTVFKKLSSIRTLTSEASSIFDFKKTINSILPKQDMDQLASRSNSIIRLNTGSSVNGSAGVQHRPSLPLTDLTKQTSGGGSGATTPRRRRSSAAGGKRRSSVSSLLSDNNPNGVVHVQHLSNFFSDDKKTSSPSVLCHPESLSDRDVFEYVYSFWRGNPEQLRPRSRDFRLDRVEMKQFVPVWSDDIDIASYKTHSPRREVSYYSPKTGKRSVRICTDETFEYECEIFHNVNNFTRMVDWTMDFWKHFDTSSSNAGALLADEEIEEILTNTRASSRRDLIRIVNNRTPRNVLKDALEKLMMPGVNPKRVCVVGHGVYTTERVSNLSELRENEPEKYAHLVDAGVIDPTLKMDETEEQSFCFLETRMRDVLDLWCFGLWTDDVWYVRLSASFERVFQ